MYGSLLAFEVVSPCYGRADPDNRIYDQVIRTNSRIINRERTVCAKCVMMIIVLGERYVNTTPAAIIRHGSNTNFKLLTHFASQRLLPARQFPQLRA